jgi:hypothetical protein
MMQGLDLHVSGQRKARYAYWVGPGGVRVPKMEYEPVDVALQFDINHIRAVSTDAQRPVEHTDDIRIRPNIHLGVSCGVLAVAGAHPPPIFPKKGCQRVSEAKLPNGLVAKNPQPLGVGWIHYNLSPAFEMTLGDYDVLVASIPWEQCLPRFKGAGERNEDYHRPRPGHSILRLLEQVVSAACQREDEFLFEQFGLSFLYDLLYKDEICSPHDIPRLDLTENYLSVVRLEKNFVSTEDEDDEDEKEWKDQLDTLEAELSRVQLEFVYVVKLVVDLDKKYSSTDFIEEHIETLVHDSKLCLGEEFAKEHVDHTAVVDASLGFTFFCSGLRSAKDIHLPEVVECAGLTLAVKSASIETDVEINAEEKETGSLSAIEGSSMGEVTVTCTSSLQVKPVEYHMSKQLSQKLIAQTVQCSGMTLKGIQCKNRRIGVHPVYCHHHKN